MAIKPKLTNAAYKVERSICDKAIDYENRVPNSHMSTCTNAMRGRVQQYEIINGLYDCFVAYLNDDYAATTWTGDILSHDGVCTGEWPVKSYISDKMSQHRFKIGKREYTGRGMGKGMSIVLRETARSKRLNS